MPVFLITVGRLVIGSKRAMDMLREKKKEGGGETVGTEIRIRI